MGALFSSIYAIPVITGSLVLDSDRTPPNPDRLRVEVNIPEGPLLYEEIPVEELGIPVDLRGIAKALSEGPELALPTEFHEALRSALASLEPAQAVWLDFRRPLGYLPVMPWERLLRPAFVNPILRLPFSAVPAVVGTQSLRIAVCAPAEQAPLLREFLQTVVPGLPTRTRVDVFTRDSSASADAPAGIDVTFHEPPTATVDEHSTSAEALTIEYGNAPKEIENPWLRWMVETIAPESIDVMHIICPGRISRNFGLLDFGISPTGAAMSRTLRLVSAGQLLSCLTQIGAWSLSLAPPETGEAGLRVIAHRLAGLLSGPVVVHAPAAGCATELADAYRFLYAPVPASPPATSTVTIVCHPGWRQEAGLTTGSLAKGGELERELFDAIESCTLDKGVLRSELRGPVDPPAWLAANQRILEQWTASVYSTELHPVESRDDGVADALRFISDAIEGSVRKHGGSR
jgi:hypothetical protein